MTTERHCQHCGYWYAVDDWHEDETVLLSFGGDTQIMRSVECPGCSGLSDAYAPELRAGARP